MNINKYVDISTLDKEAKRNNIDRHSTFIICDKTATAGKKLKVKIKIGDEYMHPDDFDHYIAWVQLWDGEKNLAQANFTAGSLGSASNNLEVDFYIVPTKNMKLTAMAFCTKHDLWQSDEVVVEVK